jgi:hypothetical protein
MRWRWSGWSRLWKTWPELLDDAPFVWTKPADEILDKVDPRTSHPRPDHQIRDTPLGNLTGLDR